MSKDFWTKAAGTTHVEAEGAREIPNNVYFSGVNSTQENGKAAPVVQNDKFLILKYALILTGGEAGKTEPWMKGRYVFNSIFVRPWVAEGETTDKIISPLMTGFLNAMYSPGIGNAEGVSKEERSQLRWENTMMRLSEIAEREGLTIDQYGDDAAMYIAAVAAADMRQNQYEIIFRPYEKKQKSTGKTFQSIGSPLDFIEDEIEKRGIVSFEETAQEADVAF